MDILMDTMDTLPLNACDLALVSPGPPLAGMIRPQKTGDTGCRPALDRLPTTHRRRPRLSGGGDGLALALLAGLNRAL
jgi:hypothetical protein